jgi:hypothetical protein
MPDKEKKFPILWTEPGRKAVTREQARSENLPALFLWCDYDPRGVRKQEADRRDFGGFDQSV